MKNCAAMKLTGDTVFCDSWTGSSNEPENHRRHPDAVRHSGALAHGHMHTRHHRWRPPAIHHERQMTMTRSSSAGARRVPQVEYLSFTDWLYDHPTEKDRKPWLTAKAKEANEKYPDWPKLTWHDV